MNRKETRSFMIKKPLMALRDVVALPGVTAYIEVAKAETVSAMEAAMNDDQMVFTVAKKDAENSDVNMDNLFEVGIVAKVKQIARMPDKYVRVVLEGGKRAHLLALETVDAGYIMATVQVDEGTKTKLRISDRNIKEYLGKPVYKPNAANEKPEVGIVRGLAWTSVGGETLEIEVVALNGTGKLELTGKLGDVMKESARIALTYVRFLVQHEVDEDYFEKHDIHIHVPEGATPKDGPSAGITMTTAIYSAVTGKPVRADIAMTGEVTLRGRVLPIGGLKEKLLAAKQAGIKEVLVPKENSRDVDEMETEILEGIILQYVHCVEDVLKEALA